jgi:N-acetylmuramoyl-L-alanine amidase CwlA
VSTPATIDYSPLPVPVLIDLIGEDQPNQNPGIAITPTSGTWHETANEGNGTDALMHQQYINNGCPDENGNPTKTSWHFTVDEDRIVQHLALNRAAWHGGDSATGLGPSVYSIAVECCVNRDGNLLKAQENTAALFGLLRAEGIIKDVYQHNKWSGKDCPRKLRNGIAISWATAQALIARYAAKYAGQDTQPAEIWWEPGKDVGIVTRASDGYKANAMLVQTYATTKRDVPVYDQIGGKKIAEVAAGEPAIIGGTTRARDAKATGWYFVRVDGGYGRARASSFLDKLPLP